MRIAAFLLGLIGGLIGLATAFFEAAVGGIGSALHQSRGHEVVGLSVFAFAVVIVALVGASLALAGRKKFAWLLLLISGLLGFIAASAVWIPAGVLILVASLLAFLDKETKRRDVGTSA